jgi:hypothetical protein
MTKKVHSALSGTVTALYPANGGSGPDPRPATRHAASPVE